ncbi:integrase [Natronolimnohabitans innermongolicus JCM 12255]|uniref:Integrase n=1 Tax=Natronolimnohabitans innermongolicus JCM 12255 TaxID=1227499 RepID=L9WP86_9EURY|nr:integrase [Natronolimnohabitans innermongolicus JCM 12255]
MVFTDLLSECYAAEFDECWERERTVAADRAFTVRFYATGCLLRDMSDSSLTRC